MRHDEAYATPSAPQAAIPIVEFGTKPRPVLRLFVPLLLIAASIALLLGFLSALGRNQAGFQREAMSTRLRQGLTLVQDRLATHHETEQVRTRLQMVAADPPFTDVVILDDRQRVMVAARQREDGSDAAALPGFDAVAARRAVESGELVIDAKPLQDRLGGYIPLLPGSGPASFDGGPKLLYGSFDLSVDRSRDAAATGNLALRAAATVFAMTLLVMVILDSFVVRRLGRVKDAMGAFARGDFASRSDVDTNDEIGGVGAAFNAMASRLELEYRRILESRERYQQVVEGTTDLVYVMEPDGRVLFINGASRDIIGREPQECVGRNSFEFLVPEDREVMGRWVDAFLGNADHRASTKIRVLRADGSVRQLQLDVRKVFHPDGRVRQVEAVARDITAMVAAEAAKEAERRRFEALFQGARDAIVLCEAQTGTMIGVNRAAEALADLPRERIVGNHYTRFVPEEAVDVLRGGEPLVRTQVARADGTTVPVEMSASRVELPDGTVVDQVNLRDVRERQQFEDRLMHAERMSVVGQLAGGVAHDFNNQLAGILGFAELLTMRLPEGQLRGYAERILTGAQRSAELTKQLLAFSRKGRHAQDPVDIHEMIREVTGILERSIDPRVHISLDLQAHRPVVLGDSTQMQNALLNLAVNARDAMPTGGDLVFTTRDLGDTDWIEVSVRDTGAGMDAYTLAHAFEPFFTTKPVGSGTGMGLAAVYGTVTGHGGTLDLSSHPGRGTTCTLRLPRLVPTVGASTVAGEGLVDDSHRERVRVLVVDDEEPVRAVIAEMLASGGHEAVTCDGGRAAIERVRHQPQLWDLVLLDLRMPDLSGEETMAQLKAIRPSLRVLLMSGYAPDETTVKLRREGARGLLRKPCTRTDLLDAVKDALGDED